MTAKPDALTRPNSRMHSHLKGGAAAMAVAAIGVVSSFSCLMTLPGVAAAATPTLKISPPTIYYPCSEGNVKFTVKAFGANKKVKLHSGSSSGPKVATITTNGTGKGSVTIDFNDVAPGSYPYVAVQGSTSATSTLTIGECP
jgi:hypothetical protein